MLTGAIMGAAIVLLILFCIFLKGKNVALAEQATKLATEVVTAEQKLHQVIERVRVLQQPVEVRFTDEQVMNLANTVLTKVRNIVDSERAAALQKMD